MGCEIYIGGVGGVIVETEAYGPDDPACHAYGGLTTRNAPLFGPPGSVYVYRSYGIHLLLNLVAEEVGVPGAVLIRALEPRRGLEAMRARRGVDEPREYCSGPGKVGQALAVSLDMNDHSFDQAGMEIVRPAEPVAEYRVSSGPRIGISRGLDRDWRFWIRESEHVSRPRVTTPKP